MGWKSKTRYESHGWSLTISGYYSTIPKWRSTCYSCRWHKRRFDSFTPNGGSRNNKVGILTYKKEYQCNREELGLSGHFGTLQTHGAKSSFPPWKICSVEPAPRIILCFSTRCLHHLVLGRRTPDAPGAIGHISVWMEQWGTSWFGLSDSLFSDKTISL
jgi:hypothetical protein